MTGVGDLVPGLLTAGLAGASVALLVPRAASAAALRGVVGGTAEGAGDGRDEARDDLMGRHRRVVSLLAATAPVVILGGVVGLVAGVVAAVVVHRILGAREPGHLRRRREMVARSLPQVVDLLAVTLAAGASPSAALSAVAAAVEGPIGDELRVAEHSLGLGRDPARVWREVAKRPGLAALGRAMTRAVETGSSVSDALHRLADDLHSSARLEAESRARAVGVRAAAPLGLCLLPAFVVLGVVPLVAGSVSSLLAR